MKSGVVFVYKTLQSKREFHGNQPGGNRNLPKRVHEFLPVLSTFFDRLWLKEV